MPVTGDNPIKRSEEDAFDRTILAHELAAELRTLDVSEGTVVAIMGPWGSGKTSLINLIRDELAKDPVLEVLEFNPWMFSGTEQLVDSFFVELASQLKVKSGVLGKVAAEVEAYGDLLSPIGALPFIGAWFLRARGAASSLKKFEERRKGGVTQSKSRLASELAKLDRPIVVVIDDIDRLNTEEIRSIFKLVRLTASFPNVMYVVAFDRGRVERALAEEGVDGRAYLEKIVQVPFDIPSIPEESLRTALTRSLDAAFADLDDFSSFDQSRWPDVLVEIVAPPIRNMRDVRRYTAAVRATVRGLGDQIELVDLLGLEAVRVFLPDVFVALVAAQEALTSTREALGGGERPELKQAVERLLQVADDHEELVRALVVRLFPAAGRYLGMASYGGDWLGSWLRARRVSHPDIFALYIERTANSGLRAFMEAERAFGLLADEQQLTGFLESIDLNRLQDVVAALEHYEGEYPEESIPVAAKVLLNLLPRLPDNPRGMFDFDAPLVVRRVMLRMLRQLSHERVAEILDDVLPQIETLSSRFTLVALVGHWEDVGHKLVTQEDAVRYETQVEGAIEVADGDRLRVEWDLLRLLVWYQRREAARPSLVAGLAHGALNIRVLESARQDVRSQTLGTRTVNRTPQLAWEALITVYGDEAALRLAVESVRERGDGDPSLDSLVELADKYLSGWRPSRFED